MREVSHVCNDPEFLDRQVWENSVNPDQTSQKAVWANLKSIFVSSYLTLLKKEGLGSVGNKSLFFVLEEG